MAKKARTPAPPKRPVQAPQRRETKKRGGDGQPRTNMMWIVAGAVAIAAVAAALYFGLRGSSSSAKTGSTGKTSSATAARDASFNRLPGVRKTKAPWKPEYVHLDERLATLNLTQNPTEQLAYHIHQHLDVFLNGKHITVPAGIGIFPQTYITELHSHDPTGVIHIEAPANKHYTLGTFFAEWGVFLNRTCVGGYCQGYTWYVNGKRQTGNPQDLELRPHLEIVIAIGKPPKKILSTYAWAGL